MDDLLSVPRVIHRVWLGDAPLPERLREYGESWVAHHPSWEHRLWTDDDIRVMPFAGAVARGEWLAERSDLLRYELLWHFGGLYVDADMECLKPIDPLLADVSLLTAWEIPGRSINGAVLAATPEHPAIELVRREARRALSSDKPVEHSGRAGPPTLTRVLEHHEDATILGPEAFYPPIREKDLHRLDGTEPPLTEGDLRHLRKLAAAGIATSGRAASFEWPDRTFAVHHESGLGRERDDPQLEMDRLTVLLEKATKKERRLRDQLNSVQSSRWWQLGLKLGLAPARKERKPAGR